jgi:hypothetical protein
MALPEYRTPDLPERNRVLLESNRAHLMGSDERPTFFFDRDDAGVYGQYQPAPCQLDPSERYCELVPK